MLITPRIVWKVLHETRKNVIRKKDSPLRILVVGAGDGGNTFINTVEDRKLNFEIVGIIDRDPNKLGTFIRTAKVLG
ncbi:nucleoside-diphosphate sugar epimerase/dehydratase, partial [Streptococcus suis]